MAYQMKATPNMNKYMDESQSPYLIVDDMEEDTQILEDEDNEIEEGEIAQPPKKRAVPLDYKDEEEDEVDIIPKLQPLKLTLKKQPKASPKKKTAQNEAATSGTSQSSSSDHSLLESGKYFLFY